MNHNDFILSPVSDILRDVVSASIGIGSRIEAYPLCDYVMQSVFLKMTGAQEQKMKCICWELATNDYEYRYTKFTQNKLGECSSYTEKNTIYKDLIDQIKKHDSANCEISLTEKNNILAITKLSIEDTFLNSNLNSNLLIWAQKSFNEYRDIWTEVSDKHFCHDKNNNENNNLLTQKSNVPGKKMSLREIYEDHLYKHRNRVAHNTQSYQQNLPTLKTLRDKNYKYENYFIYFAILILIDNIFVNLYNKYLQTIEDA